MLCVILRVALPGADVKSPKILIATYYSLCSKSLLAFQQQNDKILMKQMVEIRIPVLLY